MTCMFRAYRIRRAHARFLESCRNLEEGRNYWQSISPLARWFLQLINPIPLLGLHEEGKFLLDALQWLEMNAPKEPLREATIRHYHALILAHGSSEAGQYRRIPISINRCSLKCPSPQNVSPMLKQLDLKLLNCQERLDQGNPHDGAEVLRVAVDTYHRIGLIHPFTDGNGRVCRLALNHVMRRYGQPYVLLPPISEAPTLLAALEDANSGRLNTLLELATALRHPV